MKNITFLLLVLILSLAACKENTNSPIKFSSVLPSSTGSGDEIMLILPDALNDSSLNSFMGQKLNGTYRILPSDEAMFKISQVDYSIMNDFMYRYRNIIIAANTNEVSKVLGVAKQVLTPEQFKSLEEGKQFFFNLKNVWSQPQNVFFVFGTNTKRLKENVAKYAPKIKETISKDDREVYRKVAFINGSNLKLKEQWQEFHNISYDIPADYKLAENEGNFVSLRKDIKKGMIFLFFDVVYYNGEIPDANYGIKLRDERGKYVSSNSRNSYTVTDSTLGFIETKTTKDDLIIYETSGLWRMENDFMGGPFINQYIIDNKNKRVIFLDGFIYAPGENKKKRYMRQIEAILATLKVR